MGRCGPAQLSVWRYVIFYEQIDDGIDIVRVLQSARDIDAVLGEDR